jgi:hypothetical protein
VDVAFVQKTHDRNFDAALGALAMDLKSLAQIEICALGHDMSCP